MRSSLSRQQVGPLVALIGASLLLAACTDDGTGNDVRSPAPTGSLTPASSTGASASPSPAGDVDGGDAAIRLTLPVR